MDICLVRNTTRTYDEVLHNKEVIYLGVQLCNCGATAIGSGTTTVQVGPFPITINFDVNISICPNCMLAGSTVNASFTVTSLFGTVTASFSGAPTGFPICTVENGVQILEVEVEGELIINGGAPDNVTFTLTLNSTNQVCIDLTVGPITLPCLTVPVVFTC
jgi:hypothetical protein